MWNNGSDGRHLNKCRGPIEGVNYRGFAVLIKEPSFNSAAVKSHDYKHWHTKSEMFVMDGVKRSD